jgi:hypothetical protein
MAYTDIDKPSDYFDTLIYSGNASNPRTLSGLDFQPNWTWLKNRTDNNGHTLADSVRGANKTLDSSGTGAEITDKNDGHLDAFTSDGFTVGAGSSGDARVNDGSHTYVAWNWKAGTSFTNDASGTGIGSIDSAGSVSTTAGFSIVSYTGSGSSATIAHALGSKPDIIFTKQRDDNSAAWGGYVSALGATKDIGLSTTGAADADTSYWGDTEPTSTVFTVSSNARSNASGEAYIAYCFTNIKGYSKIGSYTGNGNADGTFVYTGFKVAFLMIKNTSTGSTKWTMCDNKRDGFNDNNHRLFAEEASVESTSNPWEMYSNGFKMTSTGSFVNVSGSNYIYMAFAENPFTTSTGVPATAR